ncbi:unnamed protein product [Arabidopsis thaliana]|uniref:Uncharacterized protein n=1 Tax=Arabidopsis thaliana TaxID=3702 RepID=A0A5S9WS56_ARATH|nr:unnamed protein product [Arabidopsis thaliana]
MKLFAFSVLIREMQISDEDDETVADQLRRRKHETVGKTKQLRHRRCRYVMILKHYSDGGEACEDEGKEEEKLRLKG